MLCGVSTHLEENLDLTLDYTKLQGVAGTGQHVVPVVLQHAETGEVLFLAYANELALQTSLQEGTAVLWSTSRNELWRKGATSGDVLKLIDVRVNCEQNSLLYRVVPARAGVCHTKDEAGQTRSTCYYRHLVGESGLAFVTDQ